MTIRPVHISDAPRIAHIYAYYVSHTTLPFEIQPPGGREIERRIRLFTNDYPWLVYERDGTVLAYAYAARFKEREAYRFTAELSIYVDHEILGSGIGTVLYSELIAMLRAGKTAVLLGTIALANDRSVSLHEKLGFRNVGILRNVGYKFNRWIDVGFWELEVKDPVEYRPP
jgi:phosphinothricin acetyltransferase